MRQREYQFIFFLNIRHSFYSETELGKKHSHTWEMEVTMHPRENELVQFREAEQVIQNYLESFQDKYLNMIAPFNRMNPSIENFLDHVAGDINQRMLERGWEVKELRISENPTRTYAIDQLHIGELMKQGDLIINDVMEEEIAEAAATEELKTGQVAEEPPIVTKWLIDTDELRVKTQTTGSMTRVVITVP